MERIEKLFNTKISIIIFYVIVALLAYLITRKVDSIDKTSQKVEVVEKTYYA